MSQKDQYYDYQPSFNTGEISPEVANRTDLEKYKSALVKARNCYIRPYGAVYKRPGTVLVGETKYANKKCIILEFHFSSEIAYLLEIGDKYIRVWRNGNYLGVEVETPFGEAELIKLRFCQSSDTLFIASGTHNVRLLQRYSESDWRLSEMELGSPYFDLNNTVSGAGETGGTPTVDIMFNTPGSFSFTAPVTGEYTVTIAGGGGGGIFFRKLSNNGRVLTPYVGGGGNGQIVTTTMSFTKNVTYTGCLNSNGTSSDYYYQEYNDKTWPGVSRESYDETFTAGSGGGAMFNGVTAVGGSGGRIRIITTLRESEHPVYMTRYYPARGASAGEGNEGAYLLANGSKLFLHPMAGDGSVETIVDQGEGTVVGSAGASVRIQRAGTGGSSDDSTIYSNGTTGTVTLISNKGIFSSGMVGACVKLWHDMPSKTITLTTGTSASLLVGQSWKILTHGNWGGTVKVQWSKDNSNWNDYREYKSIYKDSLGDNNVSESGTFDEHRYIRAVLDITGGTCTADLSRLAYEHEGYAQITSFTDKQSVIARVIEEYGSTDKTNTYALSCWCEDFGYPKCVGFFQDRLVLAGTEKYPYAVWMSRSGDYYNYSVEKADGTVTDDSAVMLNIISRNESKIQHLLPGTDLVIFTETNEWLISGSSTVTPSACVAKMQSYRGCTDVIPVMVGSVIIYVQKRARTVREFSYSFDTDNYDGTDLTILAKHLTRDTTIIDAAYEQDPDSLLFFVTDAGKINVLSYIRDQKVYAWSSMDTEGQFEAVTNVTAGTNDTVYAVVKRVINGIPKRYIERFAIMADSDNPDDNIMLDMTVGFYSETPVSSVSGLTVLAGATVSVMADGREYRRQTISGEGVLTIAGANAKSWTIGFPYLMEIEQPNFEVMTRAGTQQGKTKKISDIILRLTNSMGGRVGSSDGHTDEIKYAEYETGGDVKLYTGDKKVTVPNKPIGGYLNSGRVYINSDSPYPFYLSSIVRVVNLGG